MSEFIKKQFLDYEGLSAYDELIKAYVDKKTEGIASSQAIIDLANSVNNLTTTVNTLSTQVDTNKADIATNTATISTNTADIADNTEAIETLNGDENTEGSVAKTVSDAIKELVAEAPETYDTLKEIADWISKDETASAALINRVAEVEEKAEANANDIADLKEADASLKAYVDVQDQKVYDSIGSIVDVKISGLFRDTVTVAEGESVADKIATLTADEKLVLTGDEKIEDDITVPENAYIDANGAEFSGNITIPENSVIDNAVFTGKVTIG